MLPGAQEALVHMTKHTSSSLMSQLVFYLPAVIRFNNTVKMLMWERIIPFFFPGGGEEREVSDNAANRTASLGTRKRN